MSEQLQDFCREEIRAVKTYSDLPVTTNMMMYFSPLDYDKWAEELDVISWDSYPSWHTKEDEVPIAVWAAFMHNQMRGFQKKPFLMMESTPSLVNWDEENNVKRPGMNYLSSMQAIALGSKLFLKMKMKMVIHTFIGIQYRVKMVVRSKSQRVISTKSTLNIGMNVLILTISQLI